MPIVSAVRAIRPSAYFDGQQLHRAPALGITAAGTLADPAGLPVEDLDGIVLPGLLNAHTHLEVAPVARPAERGFLPWLRGLQAAGGAYTGADAQRFLAPARERAAATRAAGTAVAGDISNTGLTGAVLADAGITGACFHERIGIDVPTHPRLPGTVPVAHAVYSTHPDWIQESYQAAAACGQPWSIHVDEDPFEAEFLRGDGPWPGILRAFGRDLDGFRYPHCSPVAYLEALGVLGPTTLLVHCVCSSPRDLDRVASAGATICLCVRSNLWIGGRLPDLRGILERGIRVVVGTDSLASSPDLDVLAELAALLDAFPWVDPADALRWATQPALTAAPDVTPAATPLLWVSGVTDLRELIHARPGQRRWLDTLGGPA